MRPALSLLLAFVLLCPPAVAQQDTVAFQWPNPPFKSSHYLNATFSEFRNTLSANHFHNGTDIGEPDRNPIYASIDGVVYAIGTSITDGTSAYVRVKTPVPGGWKHISYVHIEPAPGIAAGVPVVAGVTILGNVLSGMGHVHLTEREIVASENSTGVEINSVRSGGGLTPFVDTWSPVFDASTLAFRRSGTRSTLAPNVLFGRVDIVVRVNERNSPEAVGGTRTNNGTYALGYRIVAPDSQTIIYEPPDAGLRYRFDRKPNDASVGFVFDEALSTTNPSSAFHYYVTNGGGADAVNATRVVFPYWFDADQIPPGDYLLQLFTYDTRQNRTDWFVPIHITDTDLSPPDRPTLLSALPDSDDILITWLPPTDPDLNGFRLYLHSESGGDYFVGEATLTKTTTSYRVRLPSDVPAPFGGLPRVQVRLTAVDTAIPPNQSEFGDVYLATPGNWGGVVPRSRFLIVDGFDRHGGSGSWGLPTHAFALAAGSPYPPDVAVGTVANERVQDGSVGLAGWDLVHWMLGDESTTDNTFSGAEQSRVRQYLESGGTFVVSGSEIGWDLGRAHNLSEPGDLSFYNAYLKAQFIFDGNSSMSTATGVAGTPLQGYTWTFGTVYPEDYPDDIEPMGGAVPVLTYNAQRDAQNFRKAGIGYVGPFGQSSATGRLVYFAFPFESISSPLQRQVLFQKSLEFMGLTTGVAPDGEVIVPATTELDQNFPNPFNPSTTFRYRLAISGHVRLAVYDLLGREIALLVNDERAVGTYTVEWNAAALSSGFYLLRLQTGTTVRSRKVLLLR